MWHCQIFISKLFVEKSKYCFLNFNDNQNVSVMYPVRPQKIALTSPGGEVETNKKTLRQRILKMMSL